MLTFVLTNFDDDVKDASTEDGGNYIVRARNAVGEKDCTLALNFGGPLGDDENIPAKIYEQPELKQPDPSILILEAHVHANPRPKVLQMTRIKLKSVIFSFDIPF